VIINYKLSHCFGNKKLGIAVKVGSRSCVEVVVLITGIVFYLKAFQSSTINPFGFTGS
jgi:hypothetical protein